MASVAITQIGAMNTLVSSTNLTSADTVYTVTGLLEDNDVIVVWNNGANSSVVAQAVRGDYPNGDSSLSGTDADTLTTIAASTVRVIDGIDGSKYRNTDGEIDFNIALTGAGSCNVYAFTK